MKVLVMSDTHGWDYNAKAAVEKEKPDVILHLGDVQESETEFCRYAGVDVPAYFVEGNCDRYGFFPETQVVELAGHRIFMTHGHRFYVSFGTDELARAAISEKCDVAIYGHTHRPDLDMSDPDLLILNPGSMTSPRQKGGMPTYMVLTLLAGRKPSAELRYLK